MIIQIPKKKISNYTADKIRHKFHELLTHFLLYNIHWDGSTHCYISAFRQPKSDLLMRHQGTKGVGQ